MTDKKVWFITGAGRGIGGDLASAALEAGYLVVATAQNADTVTAEVGTHDNLLSLSMDVTDAASIDAAIDSALKRFGRIDVLINNAGRFYAGFFETMSAEQVRAQMEVNFFGTLNITRAVLPIMRSQRQGHLVTISALAGVAGFPFMSIFSASKFALEGWMEALSSEIAPFGITTTLVEPGAFRTKSGNAPKRTVFSEIAIDDYAEQTKTLTDKVNAFYGNEPGDRNKFASAFISVLERDHPPKRWVAGKDAVEGIVRKGSQLGGDAVAFFDLSTELHHDD